MPRPRKSTAILEASGAFTHDPQRRRSVDTEPTGNGDIGEPPARLDEQQKAAWGEIVSMLDAGVLKRSDRVALEHAARLFARMWDGSLTASEGNTLLSIISRLGATPADRSRVSVPVSQKGNEFAE